MAGSRLVNTEAPRAGTLTLRAMEPGDLPAVIELERIVYPQPWSERVFEDELTQPGRVYAVAMAADRLVGYAGVMVIEDDAHITTLAVDPDVRRDQLGTRLMLHIVDRVLEMGARHATLEVRMSNRAAQRLYSKFGLAPVGVRKDYYANEDALVMWATDIDAAEYLVRIEQLRSGLDSGDG